MAKLLHGDCLEVLSTVSTNSIDSLITDPPAGISFMGKEWDGDRGGRDHWIIWMTEVMVECFRVMKPGAHGLVWALPRTSHWTATALENAGFEVRDCIYHLHGTGFPKSLNVKKAAGKAGISCVCAALETTAHTDLSGLQNAIPTEIESGSAQSEALQSQMLRDLAIDESDHPKADESDFAKRDSCRPFGGIQGEALNAPKSKPGLGGRSDLQKEQGELCRAEIRSVSERIPADGSQGRLCDGASIGDGALHRQIPFANGSGAPQGSQHPEQRVSEPRTVPGQPFTQTCGSCRKARFAEGIGTALKPAVECWWLIRKPLAKGNTVAANVLQYGTGGLNIDASRIATPDVKEPTSVGGTKLGFHGGGTGFERHSGNGTAHTQGRFPANLVLDEEAAAMLDEQSGTLRARGNKTAKDRAADYNATSYQFGGRESGWAGDSGGASRFFYVAKASKADKGADNTHPTVKSTALMEYLIRLITPPGGTVLDPFMGSGSTGVAAVRLGNEFIGIEREADFHEIAESRITAKEFAWDKR